MKKLNFLILIALLTFSQLAKAQKEEKTINYKGFSQLFFSSIKNGDESIEGFSVRRLRIKPYGKLSEKMKWAFQFDFGKNKFSMLDVYLRYELNEKINFQAGKFASAGARSGALLSSSKLTCIQRSTISQKWGTFADLHGHRNIGFQIDGKIKGLYYAAKIASYSGKDLLTPTVTPEDKNPFDKSLAFDFRLEYFITKNFSFGGFIHQGNKRIPETDTTLTDKKHLSYGGHILYKSNNLRLFAEYIKGETITTNEIINAENLETKEEFEGFFAEAGYKINKFMPVARFSYYKAPENEDLVSQSNITLGLNYYPIKNVKLQANYIIRSEEMKGNIKEPDNNIFLICFQYSFFSNK